MFALDAPYTCPTACTGGEEWPDQPAGDVVIAALGGGLTPDQESLLSGITATITADLRTPADSCNTTGSDELRLTVDILDAAVTLAWLGGEINSDTCDLRRPLLATASSTLCE